MRLRRSRGLFFSRGRRHPGTRHQGIEPERGRGLLWRGGGVEFGGDFFDRSAGGFGGAGARLAHQAGPHPGEGEDGDGEIPVVGDPGAPEVGEILGDEFVHEPDAGPDAEEKGEKEDGGEAAEEAELEGEMRGGPGVVVSHEDGVEGVSVGGDGEEAGAGAGEAGETAAF